MTAVFSSIGFSYRAVIRALSLTLAVAAIVSGLLRVSQVDAHAPYFALPAYLLLAVLFFVPPVVSGILSVRGSIRTLGRANGALAACRLVATFAWAPLTSGGGLPSDVGTTWAATLVCVSSAAAAVAWRPRTAWLYLVAACTSSYVAQVYSTTQDVALPAALNSLDAFAYGAILTGLVIAVKKSGSDLDTISSHRSVGAAEDAVSIARSREHARAQRMMHDSILVTLLLASRDEPLLRMPLADEARRALVELRELEHSGAGTAWPVDVGSVTAEVFVGALLGAVRAKAPRTLTNTQVDAAASLPADVAAAIVEAASEAVRNSLRHAPGADRSVSVVLGPSGVSVVIADDGPGFDPALVMSARMGVSGSIVGRMHAVPGGSVAVDSRVGGGCRIMLGWNAA